MIRPMKVMLGSGGFRGDARRDALTAAMRRHFGDIQKLLFVPFALHDGDAYLKAMQEAGFDAGYELMGIHRCPDPVQAIQAAEGIYLGGGNSFRLIKALQDLELLEPIRARVADDMPYLGVSAGTNMACPTMQTTNDMPIVQPASFKALGLIPFQINTHYFDGQVHVQEGDDFHSHYGETRAQRIAEFHECQATPVLGLREAGWLELDNHKLMLRNTSARLFRPGQEIADFEPDADLSFLLDRPENS
jgi:dipeptidase E